MPTKLTQVEKQSTSPSANPAPRAKKRSPKVAATPQGEVVAVVQHAPDTGDTASSDKATSKKGKALATRTKTLAGTTGAPAPKRTRKTAAPAPLDAALEDGVALGIDDALEGEIADVSIDEAPAPALESLLTGSGGGRNGRKPIVPPSNIKPGMTLFEYMRGCTPPLDKKIIDIACSQSNVFGDLRRDVAQEVALTWSNYLPNTEKYKPGQIASYAHRIAGHVALKVRRELGSAVRLPGSAFRDRPDGTSYVTPGVLAQALDWNDIESWMLLDGSDPGVNGISSLSMEAESVIKHIEENSDTISDTEAEDASRNTRLQLLDSCKDHLTARQYAILKSMIEGSRLEEIMAEHDIKKGLLLREIHIATELMGV